MASIREIMTQASQLRISISRLLQKSTYHQHGDLSALAINRQDSEQLLLLDELECIMEKLSDVDEVIRYLEAPQDEISHLHKNSSGHYETAQGHVFYRGYGIEALVSDDRHNVPYWTRTRVDMTAVTIT